MFSTTIDHVSLLMGFVQSATVVVPDRVRTEFATGSSGIDLEFVAESELLDLNERTRLPQLDHQSRNYLLRAASVERLNLPDEFIMADDDSRPLFSLDVTFFKSDDRYHSYYFYDLNRWPSSQSEFDIGQHSTASILSILGYPCLSYASHMPQIINRGYFNEATSILKPYSGSYPICEWSAYFNIARTLHPESFHDSLIYQTLAWPEHPASWPLQVAPTRYQFENHWPQHYKSGNLFTDLTGTDNLVADGVEKIIRWRRFVTGYATCQNTFRVDAAIDGVMKTLLRRMFNPVRKLLGLTAHGR